MCKIHIKPHKQERAVNGGAKLKRQCSSKGDDESFKERGGEENEAKKQKTLSDEVEVAPINKLPPEILEIILGYAVVTSKNNNGFLNMALVCPLWNEIILSSSKTMKSLGLNFEVNKFKKPLQPSRAYQTLTLCASPKFRKRANAAVQKIPSLLVDACDLLRTVVLRDVKLNNNSFVALNSLKGLKSLSLRYCHLAADECEVAPITLDKLMHLELRNSTELIPWIGRNLQSLDLFSDEDADPAVGQFINECNQLKALKMNYCNWSSEMSILDPKFSLDSLELTLPSNLCELKPNTLGSIISLGKSLKKTATVTIRIGEDVDGEFLINFLNSCAQIHQLIFETVWPIEANVDELRTMHEVARLEIHTDYNLTVMEKLTKKLPNIQLLTLHTEDSAVDESSVREPISKLNVEFKNLNSLTIHVPIKRDENNFPVSYASTAKLWENFSFKSSLKELNFVVDFNTALCQNNSLIKLYNDWISADKRPSVKACSLAIQKCWTWKYDLKILQNSRDDRELKVFGRVLSVDEKQFFTRITIDSE